MLKNAAKLQTAKIEIYVEIYVQWSEVGRLDMILFPNKKCSQTISGPTVDSIQW